MCDVVATAEPVKQEYTCQKMSMIFCFGLKMFIIHVNVQL